ncbi:MAG: DUF481 domain-containing protein, partial [Verrucomicrobiota bacterium]
MENTCKTSPCLLCSRYCPPAWVFLVFAIFLLPAAVCGESEKDHSITTGAGLSISQGNSDQSTGDAYLTWQKKAGKNIFRLDAEASYGEASIEENGSSSKETITDTGELGLNYKRKINISYGYTDASIFYDKVAEVDYRARIVCGAGCYLLKTDRATANIDAGAGYLWEENAGKPEEYPLLRISQRYDQEVGTSAKVWQTFEYLMKADDVNRYMLNAETGVQAPMTAALNIRITLNNRYNSDPAEGIEKNDLT